MVKLAWGMEELFYDLVITKLNLLFLLSFHFSFIDRLIRAVNAFWKKWGKEGRKGVQKAIWIRCQYESIKRDGRSSSASRSGCWSVGLLVGRLVGPSVGRLVVRSVGRPVWNESVESRQSFSYWTRSVGNGQRREDQRTMIPIV